MRRDPLHVNNSDSDAEGTKSDSEKCRSESGSEKLELTPCSGPANQSGDGSQSCGGGPGSEEPDATLGEEKLSCGSVMELWVDQAPASELPCEWSTSRKSKDESA